MSVIGQAKVKWCGRSGEGDGEYRAIYLVKTDSSEDGPIIVERAPGVPDFNTHYSTGTEYSTRSVCTDRSSKCIGGNPQGHFIWEVTCEFSIPDYDPEDPKVQPGSNPATWPLELEIDGEEYDDYPKSDVNGRPYQNTAGEPFPAEVSRTPKNYGVVSITKYQTTNPLALLIVYQNTVNDDWFYGFPPGTLKLAKIRASYTYINDVWIWKTTYIFHYREPAAEIPAFAQADAAAGNGETWTSGPQSTWFTEVLDVGEYYWGYRAGEGYHKVYNTMNDQPISGPIKLDPTDRPDGYANKLADGKPVRILQFQKFPAKNFAALNL